MSTTNAGTSSDSTHASPSKSPLDSTQDYTVNTDGKFDPAIFIFLRPPGFYDFLPTQKM
jgi:hypothetical protein